jgi:hypothetical protein
MSMSEAINRGGASRTFISRRTFARLTAVSVPGRADAATCADVGACANPGGSNRSHCRRGSCPDRLQPRVQHQGQKRCWHADVYPRQIGNATGSSLYSPAHHRRL